MKKTYLQPVVEKVLFSEIDLLNDSTLEKLDKLTSWSGDWDLSQWVNGEN